MKTLSMPKPFSLKSGPHAMTGALLAMAVFIADQVTKFLVMEKILHVTAEGSFAEVPVFPGLNFVMVWNRGVSFGMFNSADPHPVWIFCLLSLAICGALAGWMAVAQKKLQAFALAAIIGGAIGNMVDRIRFGAVADFIDVYAGDWHWYAFNIADSAVVIGAALLIFDAFFDKEGKNEK